MKLYSVTMVLKPGPRERKYPSYHFHVLAAGEAEAIEKVKAAEAHHIESPAFLGIHARELDDEPYLMRISTLDKDDATVRRYL